MPLYVSNTLNFIKNLYEVFYDVPILLFVETGFFKDLPETEKYYAVPHIYSGNNSFKKWGFHGIWHSYNDCIHGKQNKTISIVIDNYTTVCAINKGKPVTVSFGCTPLEGIMGRTSCGEIDPGIVFYLMHHMGYSVQKIDEILKKQSGFLGLTGQNMEINEMLKYCGKEDAINQAVIIYFNQLKKYVGESMAILNGVSDIVFSGKSINALFPIIFYLIKDVSYFDIALNPLPWSTKEKISQITTNNSKIHVYINSQTLPEVIYSLTVEYIRTKNMVNNNKPQKLETKNSANLQTKGL
jgi:acetate kinase